ncbi:MAG: S-adenosyl-L-homocysteine hydrolase [Altererythrobacter sp.]|nr:S-adenosyl-L-homocysteine hydrolase [Altererythrobacter sp.]
MSILKCAAAVSVALATIAAPLPALAGTGSEAEALRKLDIMLMVTSLRCRTTAHNFQADYQRFSSTNLTTLNAAARSLHTSMSHTAGKAGAKRALDRISVGMANEYGRGHPWLTCGELKRITGELASGRRTQGELSAAADELLASHPRGQWTMALAR